MQVNLLCQQPCEDVFQCYTIVLKSKLVSELSLEWGSAPFNTEGRLKNARKTESDVYVCVCVRVCVCVWREWDGWRARKWEEWQRGVWEEKVRFEERTTGRWEEGKKNMKGPFGEEEEEERERRRRRASEREVCRKRSVGKINMLSGATGRDNQSCLTLVSPWCQHVCVYVCVQVHACVWLCVYMCFNSQMPVCVCKRHACTLILSWSGFMCRYVQPGMCG